jgi:hypothetical protein
MVVGSGGWGLLMGVLMLAVPGEVSDRDALRGSGVGSGETRAEAIQAAEENAQKDLRERLGRLAHELTGWSISDRACWEEILWLSEQQGVSREKEVSTELKKYGAQATVEITLTLSDQVLKRWQERLAEKHRQWLKMRLWGVLGTVGGWLVWLAVLALWDRGTLGYRRGLIAIVGLLVGGTLTAAAWVWIFILQY